MVVFMQRFFNSLLFRASPFLSWKGVVLLSLELSTVPPVFAKPRVSRGLEAVAYFYFKSEGCMFSLL